MQLSEFEHRLIHVLHEIAYWLRVLAGKHQTAFDGAYITNLGGSMNPIQPGGSGVFQFTLTLKGVALTAAAMLAALVGVKVTWAASPDGTNLDAGASFSADPGGDQTKIVLNIAASDTNTSDIVAVKFLLADGVTTITATPTTVAIGAPPPPPQAFDGASISRLS